MCLFLIIEFSVGIAISSKAEKKPGLGFSSSDRSLDCDGSLRVSSQLTCRWSQLLEKFILHSLTMLHSFYVNYVLSLFSCNFTNDLCHLL